MSLIMIVLLATFLSLPILAGMLAAQKLRVLRRRPIILRKPLP